MDEAVVLQDWARLLLYIIIYDYVIMDEAVVLQDWARLFDKLDRKRRGVIDRSDFRYSVRHLLKIADMTDAMIDEATRVFFPSALALFFSFL